MSYANVHDEVKNGFDKKGPGNPPTQMGITGLKNEGLHVMSDGPHMQLLNAVGGGFVSIVQNNGQPIYQQGNETTVPNQRKTASWATQSGITNVASLVGFGHADGGAITIDGGGGRQSTILACTSSGKGSISITDNAISLCVGGTEFVVYADGRVTSTYSVVQEPNRGGGTVNPPSSGKAVA